MKYLRYILICSVVCIILVVCIISAVVLTAKDSSSEIQSQNISMTSKFKNLRASKGEKSIQWVVDITSHIGKLNVAWYGPGCNMIEMKNGPSKYEIDITHQWNGKMQTVLKVQNVTESDRGLYKLRVYNNEDEHWDYFTLSVTGDEHIVACYVAEWAHVRVGQGKFTVDDIDPTQCTHLLYAFANLNRDINMIWSADPGYDLDSDHKKGAYKKMTSLKREHPHLKVLISMGGWAERLNKNYSFVAESPVRRKHFIRSVVDFLSEYNFDGLDLHWQYPGQHHGVPADKENFVYLLKELREEFDRVGEGWLLTAPLGVIPSTVRSSYNIPELSKYLHYMFALCYSYHGFWDRRTGPNAPLYSSGPGDVLDVHDSIQSLLELGAAPEKLVLGVPLNGHSFIVEDEKDNIGFGEPTEGEGFIGPYVQEPGTWGYNEICSELIRKKSKWTVHWDDGTYTPYMTYNRQFISYDNERSLAGKAEYALKKKLAGVVAYSLDTDDFRGDCGMSKYPLMSAINKAVYTASYGPMVPCNTT